MLGSMVSRWIGDESGQDMVEYGLLAAFISITAVAILKVLGPLITPLYDQVRATLVP